MKKVHPSSVSWKNCPSNIFIGTIIHKNYAAFILLSTFAVIPEQTCQDLATWHSDAFYKIIVSNFSPVSLTYIWSRSWPTSYQLILFLNSHSWMEPVRHLPLVETWWGHVVGTTCCPPPQLRFCRGTCSIHPSVCSSIHPSGYYFSSVKVHKLLWLVCAFTGVFSTTKSQRMSLLSFAWPFEFWYWLKIELYFQHDNSHRNTWILSILLQRCSPNQYLRRVWCCPFYVLSDLSN